ncbi:hypothetical protein [Solidesulfovibrio sp. C21]|uniref:hypothetical protein n=1 Tax=Solidesulfovibrio sp. C21 TaxID=3398613 RepID=UPI0039FC4DB5
MGGCILQNAPMLSAHAFADYEQKGLAAGCDGFMTKPIRKGRLIEVLRQAVGAKKSRSDHAAPASPHPAQKRGILLRVYSGTTSRTLSP